MLSFKALFQGVKRRVTFEDIVSCSYFFTKDFNIHTVCPFYIASASTTT